MRIADLPSPALLIDLQMVRDNIAAMIQLAGNCERLRPHCKTHKIKEIIALEREQGIRKHKCATLAEAEMLAECGVTDILLAYNAVGPNIPRVVRLLQRYPQLQFACTADHAEPLSQLSAAVAASGCRMQVLLDLDVGMHRTGVPLGAAAVELYGRIATLPGIQPGGLHVYDGHNHGSDVETRRATTQAIWRDVASFRDTLTSRGWSVPRITAGGTPSFPYFAEIDDAALELSPGTIVLHDAGYAEHFPDLPFQRAAKLLTRVISCPAADRLTLDLGHKAVAADPPAGQRVSFPALPDAVALLHNEEHLVLETTHAAQYQPGDMLLAWPTHVCPTCALHKEVYVMEGENVIATWIVASRDRV
jgi:D-threonine aldolase